MHILTRFLVDFYVTNIRLLWKCPFRLQRYSFITTLFLGPFDDVITKFYCTGNTADIKIISLCLLLEFCQHSQMPSHSCRAQFKHTNLTRWDHTKCSHVHRCVSPNKVHRFLIYAAFNSFQLRKMWSHTTRTVAKLVTWCADICMTPSTHLFSNYGTIELFMSQATRGSHSQWDTRSILKHSVWSILAFWSITSHTLL
jgi:hypothetical protein